MSRSIIINTNGYRDYWFEINGFRQHFESLEAAKAATTVTAKPRMSRTDFNKLLGAVARAFPTLEVAGLKH